jgi:hypothetical protein
MRIDGAWRIDTKKRLRVGFLGHSGSHSHEAHKSTSDAWPRGKVEQRWFRFERAVERHFHLNEQRAVGRGNGDSGLSSEMGQDDKEGNVTCAQTLTHVLYVV